MKRIFIKTLGFLLLFKVCFGAPSNSVNTPNPFTPGTTAQSAQVNADFQEVQNKYNAHTHTDINQLGTVTAGIWNANVIGTQFGGLGIDSSTAPQGSIIIYNGVGTAKILPPGTANQILTAQGSGSNPTWTTGLNGYQTALSAGTNVLYVSGTTGYLPPLTVDYNALTFKEKWVKFNGAGTIAASYGVTSISHVTTGVYLITWSANFADANYVVSGVCEDPTTNSAVTISSGSQAVGALGITTIRSSNGIPTDMAYVHVRAIGN